MGKVLKTSFSQAAPRVLSCIGCRKRKMKCSRSLPCLGCTERGKACLWEDGVIPTKSTEEATVEALELENALLRKDNEGYRRLLSFIMGQSSSFPSFDQLSQGFASTSTAPSNPFLRKFVGISPETLQHLMKPSSPHVDPPQLSSNDFQHLVQSLLPNATGTAVSSSDYTPPSPVTSSTSTSCQGDDHAGSSCSSSPPPDFSDLLNTASSTANATPGFNYSAAPHLPFSPLPSPAYSHVGFASQQRESYSHHQPSILQPLGTYMLQPTSSYTTRPPETGYDYHSHAY